MSHHRSGQRPVGPFFVVPCDPASLFLVHTHATHTNAQSLDMVSSSDEQTLIRHVTHLIIHSSIHPTVSERDK